MIKDWKGYEEKDWRGDKNENMEFKEKGKSKEERRENERLKKWWYVKNDRESIFNENRG